MEPGKNVQNKEENPQGQGWGNEEANQPQQATPWAEPTTPQTVEKAKPLKKNKNKKNAKLMVASLFTAGTVLAVALLFTGLSLVKASKIPDGADGVPMKIALQEPPLDTEGLSTTAVVQKIAPSVVSIDLFLKGEREAVGSGSGIIFSEDGYIVTNAHVVEQVDGIGVLLNDGSFYQAILVGQDVRNDIAVLRIKAEGLVAAEFGNSDNVEIGQRAIAVGNAAGILPGSPTQGIISGVDRRIDVDTPEGTVKMKLLQTDAAINPGNSGGALVNMYGQVIGINIAKLQSVEIDNIGFAIPSSVAVPVIEKIIEFGKMPATPLLGISVTETGRTLPETEDVTLPQGLIIHEINKKSDLKKYDIEVGDIITQIEGKPAKDSSDLLYAIQNKQAGEVLSMVIYHVATGELIEVAPVLYSPQPTKE